MTFSILLKDRDSRLALLVLLLLAAVMPIYTWHEDTSGFLTDDAMYLIMADFFSPYFDGNVYVETLTMIRSRFPPAFPMLIALFGGGSQNMGAAHLVTGMTFVLAALALYIWVRTTLGRPNLALACLVIFALLPESLFYVLELRSEFLFLAFLFAGFVAMNAATRTRQYQHELLLAAATIVGLCILTRIIGACLLGAFVIHLFVHKTPRKAVYLTAAIVLPASWYAIKVINGYSNTYTNDLIGYATVDGLRQLVAHDIPRNAWLMLTSWGANFGAGDGTTLVQKALAALLLLLALPGFIKQFKRRQPDACFVILYVGVILVWPHPDHMVRFVYPLVPIGLLYIFVGAAAIAGYKKDAPALRHRGSAAIVLATLLLIAPNAFSVALRFTAPVPEHIPADFRHTRNWLEGGDLKTVHAGAEVKSNVIALLKRVGRHTKDNECIYADHRPLTMLYAQRPAIRLPVDLSRGNLIRCKFLFVMNLVAFHDAKYPLADISHDRLELVDIEHDSEGNQQAYLFEIRS